MLARLLPDETKWKDLVCVIELPDDLRAELVMNGAASKAIAFLKPIEPE